MQLKSTVIPILSGIIIQICFLVILSLGELRGPAVVPFIFFSLIAGAVYLIAVSRIKDSNFPLKYIWLFALLFRITMLFSSPPSLSDDVYRYIWDGHLINSGINPYLFQVNSPFLDRFDIPLRALVNNDWMASPYLPTAQVVFAIITAIAPEKPLAFQITMLLLDLSVGWLIISLLKKLNLPLDRVMIYLWNPLVIIEFSHAAHIDALMLCLTMLAFWFLVKENGIHKTIALLGSTIALAIATLTKGVPILLLPLFLNRWRQRYFLIFAAILLGACLPFALQAGLGLRLPLDGDGLFGAARIYSAYWNYNSGLYHWLEVGLTGINTPGPAPYETFQIEIRTAKTIILTSFFLIMLWVTFRVGKIHNNLELDTNSKKLALVRLAVVPIGAYLLLAPTIHPWYITILIPFLPFLESRSGEESVYHRLIWPGLFLSISVMLSYLTYVDKALYQEFFFVRRIEYLPVYGILFWALIPIIRCTRERD
jgi:alpha-1,6-mannosyltransferase